jgi:SAM-dependent methyltransferase
MNKSTLVPLFCNICNSQVAAWEESAEGQDKCPLCRSVGRHRAVAMMLDKLTLSNYESALEVGGDGAMFRSKVPRLLSVDLSYRGADILANLERLPFGDNSFELILCLDVLEHVANDVLATEELYRVLKLGGTVILTFSCWGPTGSSKSPDELGMWKWHLSMDGTWTSLCYRYYTDESALTLLRCVGFQASLVQCRSARLGIMGVDLFLARK